MGNKLSRQEKSVLGFLLRHMLYGLAGGLCFGLLVLYFDIAHLRSLAMESKDGWLTILLFFFGLFITFGSVGMAAGVMGQGQDEN
jgi:hypothetical protein